MNAVSESQGALTGQVAVVTGAGSHDEGIGNGRASAVRLAEAGAGVVLVEIDEERARTTQKMIEAAGGIAVVEVADVSSPTDVARLMESVITRWGRVDVLVNNVGVAGPAGTAETVDLAAWSRCFEVNVTSMVLTSREAIPHMRRQGGGTIINMSSVAGLRGLSPAAAYSTTKGAVVALSQSMALAHGRDGIRVNVVAPGLVHTPMVGSGVDEAGRARRAAAGVLGTEGTAWDVADAVAFLAGPGSRWVTGSVLAVDGGLIGTTIPTDLPSAAGLGSTSGTPGSLATSGGAS
ncbi:MULTISPECIES: SDR family NAD(P)-dependent oxidoreductase [Streptomyces]|uniref:SDR family NAD(P)-dependent oxidoreductase n=1 Tax=Streptomyces TaxID=1883 RepID=UPI0036855747